MSCWFCYLSWVDHDRKIRGRNQRRDMGKYSCVNRTIQLWNQLPADAVGTVSCKPSNFRERVRKVISEVKWRCGGNHKKMQWSGVKWSGVKWSEVKWSEVKWSEVKWSDGRLIVVGMWRLHKCSEAEWREGHGETRVHQFMQLRKCITVTVLLYSVLGFLLTLIHQLRLIVIVFVLYLYVYCICNCVCNVILSVL
jgi:hypothetical protein